MKKLNFIYTQLLLVLAVCVTGCSTKSSEYTNVLPQDAFMVLSLDVNSLVKKSGVADKNGMLDGVLKEMADVMGGLTVKDLIHDPSALGISFTDRVYMAVKEDESVVVSFKVTDAKKLKDNINSLNSEGAFNGMSESGGVTYIDMGGELFAAFDNNTFLMAVTPSYSAANAKSYVTQLMGQSEEKSINANKGFRKLKDKKSDIAMLVSPGEISELRQQMQFYPMPYDVSAMNIVSRLNFEKGKIAMDVEFHSEDKELEKAFKNNQRANGKLKSTFLDNFPWNTLAYLTFNINGEELYKILADNEQLKQTGVDISGISEVREVLASLGGDVSLGITGLSLMQMQPEMLLLAEVKNNKIMEVLSEFEGLINMQRGMSLTKSGNDEYILKAQGVTLYIGIKNNTLYATNSTQLSKEIGSVQKESLAKGDWANAIKKGSGYFLINADGITQLAAFKMMTAMGGAQGKAVGDAVSNLHYLEVYNETPTYGVANLYLKNKEENALKQLVDMVVLLSGLN